MGESQFFSRPNLKSGFHQIFVVVNEAVNTAFETEYGHFQFLVVSMRLQYAPATLQALMKESFTDVSDGFVVAYLDCILYFSGSGEKHLKHLRPGSSGHKEKDVYVCNVKLSWCERRKTFLNSSLVQTIGKLQ